MMNQKEAVFAAVINVCGQQDGKYEPTREQRTQVNLILVEGFKAGKIQLDREYNESELKSYVSGLQSNWLRKDARLNGGVKHTIKNPGIREGSTDAQLKALKALLSTTTDEDQRSEIQEYIDARLVEINSTKKKVEINFNDLPETLRNKFTK